MVQVGRIGPPQLGQAGMSGLGLEIISLALAGARLHPPVLAIPPPFRGLCHDHPALLLKTPGSNNARRNEHSPCACYFFELARSTLRYSTTQWNLSRVVRMSLFKIDHRSNRAASR
jgi:hypothetical protein